MGRDVQIHIRYIITQGLRFSKTSDRYNIDQCQTIEVEREEIGRQTERGGGRNPELEILFDSVYMY